MRIAWVEDDADQSAMIELWLREAGHRVSVYADGSAFRHAVAHDSFDLLGIDWQLPDTGGDQILDWVRRVQDPHVPVIFVTARDSEEDIVRALELGADDYMVKPVRRKELLARIEALGRRAGGASPAEVFDFGPYHFDRASGQASYRGRPVELTAKEFDLSMFLFQNAGRVLSRGHILEQVWGRSARMHTRTVDAHVSRLRSKLGLGGESEYRLVSVYQHGYRLETGHGGQDAAS